MFLKTLALFASFASAADTASAFPGGIGPIRQALSEARAWQKDACFSGVNFTRRAHGDVFTLHFHSDTDPKESYNYATGGIFEGGRAGPKAGHYACLPPFELDAKSAIEAATAAGLRSDRGGEIHATLSKLDAEVYKDFKKKGALLKPSKSSTAWFVGTDDYCSVVDAVKGRVLYLGPRLLSCF